MTRSRFAFPVLLCDIGGTNARFACIPAPDAPLTDIVRLSTTTFPDFSAAARAAITKGKFPTPRSMLIGAAGPVKNRAVTLTNAHWTISGPEIARDLGLEQGLLLNDFETLGIALPALCREDLMPIGKISAEETGVPNGTRIVIGPGTGLGVGALINAGGRYLPVSSEGGHTGMGAETPEDMAFLAALGVKNQRIQAEMLLAGPGLPNLYRAEALLAGISPMQLPETLTPADVATAALDYAALRLNTRNAEDVTASKELEPVVLDRPVSHPRLGENQLLSQPALACSDKIAHAAIARMLKLLARFSGDMALTFLATGGVYLAGGILPKIRGLLDASAFRASFERNSRLSDLLASIPVWLILANEPAFIGLDTLARHPQRYLLNFKERLWVSDAPAL